MTGESGITHVLDVSELREVQRQRVYLLRVAQPGRPETLERVTVPVLRVGTHPGNGVVLHDETVSRIHFEILAQDDGFRIRDLGSTNGTYVDGYKVFDAYLKPSARIRAGSTQLYFELQDEESELPLSVREAFGGLVGKSRPMREMFLQLEQVAATDLTILIQGESGTGKELIAEAIHQESDRSGGPFVVFDCSAVPASLMESELFGHEKGAFTGADQRRAGCLEEADGGTLFLDEIGELPLELQPKLLRAVEKREARPLGGTKPKQVDVRVVAATHRDLSSAVNGGTFRADLYYRLAVVTVRVPPLRDRLEDLPLLAEALLKRTMPSGPAMDELLSILGRDGWRRLGQRPWPGNVRELRNFVEQAAAMGPTAVTRLLGRSEDDTDPPAAIPARANLPPLIEEPTERLDSREDDRLPLVLEIDLASPLLDQKREAADRFERAYLKAIQNRYPNNLSRAAEGSGLDRSYYKRLLKKHQL
ncbi:MAG: sigma 54-interacting transcriptional regulator [Deltaproteobacteria bacterium]|jgi:two-component system response regulator GlrR|nr:sigma 54-interacting transcriptional regulator [Deltaproteobacteria bacterium]